MNLQHLHQDARSCNCRNALELTRGGLRISRASFALCLITVAAGGAWIATWITALITK